MAILIEVPRQPLDIVHIATEAKEAKPIGLVTAIRRRVGAVVDCEVC